ncbi:MAG: hypothetical protein ABJB10_12815 [Mesorhizobium sp.]
MRTFFTSFLAFIISGFVGGVLAQQIAVIDDSEAEFFIYFLTSVLVTFVVAFVFLLAQSANDPQAAVGKAGTWMLVVLIVLVLLFVGLIFYSDANFDVVKRDIPFVVGLGLPGLVIILMQWLFVRWRVKRGMSSVEGN